jgi:outer membrane lipoprotein SlyB
MKKVSSYIGLALIAAILLSCAEWNKMNKTEQGAVIGAGAGGALGTIIGAESGNTLIGLLIGGVVGGAAGAAIGHYMDRQKDEIAKELPGADVRRVGEGLHIR